MPPTMAGRPVTNVPMRTNLGRIVAPSPPAFDNQGIGKFPEYREIRVLKVFGTIVAWKVAGATNG